MLNNIEDIKMELKEYLSEKKITVRNFSDKTDIPEDTLHKYIYKVRIPNKHNMQTLFKCTDGAVSPNDFYGIKE
ncbi:MAG: hypothetical protein Tp1123DCM1511741_27 [Prokaryotic dsDNA virus sp.]|nr:MAG: hypothetical protein Tp1123DCM1511741_27 [Prokaryotic dsDNA virus sp.]